jgi:hypothetical protein
MVDVHVEHERVRGIEQREEAHAKEDLVRDQRAQLLPDGVHADQDRAQHERGQADCVRQRQRKRNTILNPQPAWYELALTLAKQIDDEVYIRGAREALAREPPEQRHVDDRKGNRSGFRVEPEGLCEIDGGRLSHLESRYL